MRTITAHVPVLGRAALLGLAAAFVVACAGAPGAPIASASSSVVPRASATGGTTASPGASASPASTSTPIAATTSPEPTRGPVVRATPAPAPSVRIARPEVRLGERFEILLEHFPVGAVVEMTLIDPLPDRVPGEPVRVTVKGDPHREHASFSASGADYWTYGQPYRYRVVHAGRAYEAGVTVRR